MPSVSSDFRLVIRRRQSSSLQLKGSGAEKAMEGHIKKELHQDVKYPQNSQNKRKKISDGNWTFDEIAPPPTKNEMERHPDINIKKEIHQDVEIPQKVQRKRKRNAVFVKGEILTSDRNEYPPTKVKVPKKEMNESDEEMKFQTKVSPRPKSKDKTKSDIKKAKNESKNVKSASKNVKSESKKVKCESKKIKSESKKVKSGSKKVNIEAGVPLPALQQEPDNGEQDEGVQEPLSVLDPLMGTLIPLPISRPRNVQVQKKDEPHKFAAMGLETTGLGPDCGIIQITCSYESKDRKDFNCYIKPSKEIGHHASAVNGLIFEKGVLRHHGKQVVTVSLREGLKAFLNYLEKDTILISHNTTLFHSHLLVKYASKCGLQGLLKGKVPGFSDSYQLFLGLYPRSDKVLSSYKLKHLIRHFSKRFPEKFESSTREGENMKKIRNLVHLIRCHKTSLGIGLSMLYEYSSSLDHVNDMNDFDESVRPKKMSFDKVIEMKKMTPVMAKKISDSGLSLDHLRLAYVAGGNEGIFELLNPRVTKSLSVIRNICLYFKYENQRG